LRGSIPSRALQLREIAAQAEADLQDFARFEDSLQAVQVRQVRDLEQYTRCSVASWIRCGPVETSPLAKVGFDSVSKPSIRRQQVRTGRRGGLRRGDQQHFGEATPG
jgi:hypothetical protein